MKPIITIVLALTSILSSSQGFTELSATFGLDYSYGAQTYGGGVSFVDFDQDGWDDLTFTSAYGTPVHFHHNTGSAFEEIAPLVSSISETKQPIWVDYDNDGDLDLWVSSPSQNRLYRNDGNLELTDVTSTCGFSDPFVPCFNGAWLDYDDDGYLDLVTAHRFAYLVGELTLYHNLGNGTFQNVTAQSGLGDGIGNSVLAIATLDFNNDGWEDIFVGQDFQAGCLLMKNMGDGTFDNISIFANTFIQSNTMTVTIGDYDNNGFMDIYLTDTGQDGGSLLENLGNETFMDVALTRGVILNQFTWGASFFDADNDMDLDLNVDGMMGPSYMLESTGAGEFFQSANASWGFAGESNTSNGNAVGDFDNDGFPDLAKNVANSGTNTFWRNDFTENNYLVVQLEGFISNKMAVGAVVHVYSNGIHQMRRVGCGEGFSSQHSYKQFFGLGTNTTIDSLIVNWPSNMVSKLYDVAPNQLLFIAENPNAGCLDTNACNYDPDAIEDSGNCTYSNSIVNCSGECWNDIDGDNVCDELEVQGCDDENACNFSSDVTDNDGSCNYNICLGCMDAFADNYDPFASMDDGSCTYSCLLFNLTIGTDCWAQETSWNLTDPDGVILISAPTNSLADQTTYLIPLCLSATCSYTFNIFDSFGDGLSGCTGYGDYYLTDVEGNIIFQMENADFDNGTSHVFCSGIAGCINSSACNYSIDATVDDGNCIYPEIGYDCAGNCTSDTDGDLVCDELEIIGCTDPMACNYNQEATENSGCVYQIIYPIVGPSAPVVMEETQYSYEYTAGTYYDWTITNGTIISGQGTHTIIVQWSAEGMGSLNVIVIDGDNCENSAVTLEVDAVLTINELSSGKLDIYPNPAESHITISFNSDPGQFTLIILNGLGQIAHQSTNPDLSYSNQLEVDIADMATGFYTLKVKNEKSEWVAKLVIE
jgi:hypothetical protein